MFFQTYIYIYISPAWVKVNFLMKNIDVVVIADVVFLLDFIGFGTNVGANDQREFGADIKFSKINTIKYSGFIRKQDYT